MALKRITMKNREIIGFVEVKPNKKSKLRPSQIYFKKFCHKHNIPYFQWCPADPFPFENDVIMSKDKQLERDKVGEPNSHPLTN